MTAFEMKEEGPVKKADVKAEMGRHAARSCHASAKFGRWDRGVRREGATGRRMHS